ncbi:MAG: PASTA domain-containing protein [Acidimicrobiales bacterium]|nr:PASTA domain-containing protein [Acidimicrobiales bacterium]
MPGVTDTTLVGRVLGDRYRLVNPVGTGASATVYTAEDLSLERRVAVKVLHSALVNDDRFAKRFRNEAKAVAQLAHPRILNLFDWAEGDDCYLVTELLTGGSLRHMLDAGHRLSISQGVVVGLHALEGLEIAHQRGFVHRDIKPANLLFGADGRLRIADFGIARAVAESAWTEPEGALIGTARYAAPEQGSGAVVSGAADIYSLALTLIEAVTGDVPLLADSPIATMVLRQDTNVDVPAAMGPLWEPLTAAAKANPTHRPSASQLIQAFHRAAADLPRPFVLPLANLDADAPAVLDYPESTSTGGTDVVVADDDVDMTALSRTPLHFADDDLAAMGMASGEQPAAGERHNGEMTDFDVDQKLVWPWAVAAVALACVIVAMISSQVFADESVPVPIPAAIDGPEVMSLMGMNVEEARAALDAEGWVLAVERQRQSGSVPGEVLAQIPIPGNPWAHGQVVTLIVSDGPPLVNVPDVVGTHRRDAIDAIRSARLVVADVVEAFDEEVPADEVLSVSLPSGEALQASAPEGTEVALLVSKGPQRRTTPNLIGASLEDATAQLADLDVSIAVVGEDFSIDIPEGSIIETQPLPNALVEKDGAVEVVVSKGKPFVTVPQTRGQDVARATERLEAVGFVVIGVEGAPNRPVLITDPEPGSSVRMGSEILIYTRR